MLRRIQRDTELQAVLVNRVAHQPGGIDRQVFADGRLACSVQRGELAAYRTLLSGWRETQAAPQVKGVIDDWLKALDDIETQTGTVLRLLFDRGGRTG